MGAAGPVPANATQLNAIPAHIASRLITLARSGITRRLAISRYGPKRGCSSKRRCSRGELRAKKYDASSRNTVVGNPGMKIPSIPTPTERAPSVTNNPRRKDVFILVHWKRRARHAYGCDSPALAGPLRLAPRAFVVQRIAVRSHVATLLFSSLFQLLTNRKFKTGCSIFMKCCSA